MIKSNIRDFFETYNYFYVNYLVILKYIVFLRLD